MLFVYVFVLEAVKLESAEKSERPYAGVSLGTEGICHLFTEGAARGG